MYRKPKLFREIDNRFDRIEQILDFSTVQTSLLAILFTLFIFSITIIVYYLDLNIYMTLFALYAILMSLPMIPYLIYSIFVKDIKTKLFSFEFVLLYIFLSGIVILLIGIIIIVGLLFPTFLEINNYIAVFMMLFCFISIWLFYPKLIKRFYSRFDKLITKAKLKKRYVFFNNKLYDYVLRKSISNGVLFGLLITVFSGLFKNSGFSYGYPFSWLIYNPEQSPKLDVLIYSLLGNWLIISVIIFSILIAYYCFFKNKANSIKRL